jgi:hypothetical protein
MRRATRRPSATPPRRWRLAAALAAAFLVSAVMSPGVFADPSTPTDTTPTPTETTPTVTAPDAPPPSSAPKPDPGPVLTVPKQQPQVVAPGVVEPVSRPPVTAPIVVQPTPPSAKPKIARQRAKPKHIAVGRKHPAKHQPTSRAVKRPKPAASKPKPQAPVISVQRSSSSANWVNVALVAGIGLLLLPALLQATRRIRRSTSRGVVASDADLASPADSLPALHDAELPAARAVLLPSPNGEVASDIGLASPNGSRPVEHDVDIPPTRAVLRPTRAVLRPTPEVEIASHSGLAAANGSAASHDEELPSFETLGYPPMRSEPEVLLEKRCAINWWRGYVRSQFLASEAGASGAMVVAESPPFRWRSSKPPPETEEVVAAHRQLISTLNDLGWEAVGFGPAWFEVEFHRTPVASISS